MNPRSSKKTLSRYFILKEDVSFHNQEHGQSSKLHFSGTLWLEEQRFGEHYTLVRKYEGDEVGELLEVELVRLKEIKYDEAHLLLAVPEPLSNRLKIINDTNWIQEGILIIVGTVVEVYDVQDLPDGALGTVRFKGRLPGKNGTYFGIELHIEHAGKGSTNGTFRRKKFFECDEDCGLFLSLFRIRLPASSGARPKERLNPEGGATNYPPALDGYGLATQRNEANEKPLEVGERVVWMSDYGPEYGTVKWIGILPYSTNNKTVVGVEFENAVGTGTGKYKGRQLFQAKRHHASLVPLLGLLKAADYIKMTTDAMESEPPMSHTFSDYTVRSSGTHDIATQMKQMHLPKEHDDRTLSARGFNQANDSGLSRTDTDRNTYRTSGHISGNVMPVSPTVLDSGLPSARYNPFPDLDVRPKTSSHLPDNAFTSQIFIGSRVYVQLKTRCYGLVRWIGTVPQSKTPDRVVAGIEMEIEDPMCYTDGTFQGQKYFHCERKKAFFCALNKCMPDDR